MAVDKISCIYKIISSINGEIYIGSAVNYIERMSLHLWSLKKNKHHSIKLQRHVNKYGIENISFSIMEILMFKEDLIKREQYYINTLKPYFNVCKVAGSRLGIKVSEETLAKMSVAGRSISEETRKKMREAKLGKRHSEESKIKMSTASKSRPSGMKGKRHSEETKTKMSLVHQGRKYSLGTKASEETKRKISLANIGRIGSMRGKRHSEESKIKMSLANKGKKKSPESIAKRIESMKGFVCSQETKQKMREAWIRRKNNIIKEVV